jgi:hypothetical protein
MIAYKFKGLFNPMKRILKIRTSDKNKRVYDKINKLRKTWWHFKARWNDDNTK